MSSLCRNLLTGDSIILAPGRHQRPNPYGDSDVDPCPFCPGREQLTPPEVLRVGKDPWEVRAFPNKYPAVGGTSDPDEGALEGGHEVIVESPEHDAEFHRLTDEQLVLVTGAWLTRYRVLSKEGRTLILFKNSGTRAGASISHIHSQLVALPFVPPRLAHELEAFRGAAAVCPLCRPVRGNLISQGEHFRWEADECARLPYGQRIIPLSHAAGFTSMTAAEEIELGMTLRKAAAASVALRRDVAFNWGFHNFPAHSPGHWYVEIIPRIAGLAGFELAGGCYINSVDAPTAARELRASDES